MGETIFTLACPVTPSEDHSLAENPSGVGDDKSPNPPGTLPWSPPFYLAPPHYPHPVYRHDIPGQSLNTPYSPPMGTSSAPQHTGGAHPFAPDSSQAEEQTYISHQVPMLESHNCDGVHSSPASERRMEDLVPLHADMHQRPETPPLGFSGGQSAAQFFSLDTDVPVQAGVPPFQPLTDAFSQYYHYYHDPKIPLPDPPRDPNPALEAFSQIRPHLPESAAWHHGTHHPGGQTRVYHSHFFSEDPYSARDEAKQLALHISETIPKPHFPAFPENVKLTAFDLSESPDIREEINLPSFGRQPPSDEASPSKTYSPEFSRSLASAVAGAKAEEKPSRLEIVRDEPPAFPDLSPSHHLPQYPHYYVLYYPYHQMYHPGSVLAADGLLSTLSEDPSKLPPQTLSSSSSQDSSFEKPPTTAAPQGPPSPYLYRYHDYYMSKADKDKQEAHPAGAANSNAESSDSSGNGVQRRAAVSGSELRPDGSEEHEVNGKALEEKSGEGVR